MMLHSKRLEAVLIARDKSCERMMLHSKRLKVVLLEISLVNA